MRSRLWQWLVFFFTRPIRFSDLSAIASRMKPRPKVAASPVPPSAEPIEVPSSMPAPVRERKTIRGPMRAERSRRRCFVQRSKSASASSRSTPCPQTCATSCSGRARAASAEAACTTPELRSGVRAAALDAFTDLYRAANLASRRLVTISFIPRTTGCTRSDDMSKTMASSFNPTAGRVRVVLLGMAMTLLAAISLAAQAQPAPPPAAARDDGRRRSRWPRLGHAARRPRHGPHAPRHGRRRHGRA